MFLAVYVKNLILLRPPTTGISATGGHHMRNDHDKSHHLTGSVAKGLRCDHLSGRLCRYLNPLNGLKRPAGLHPLTKATDIVHIVIPQLAQHARGGK